MGWIKSDAYASRDSPPSHTLLDQKLDPPRISVRINSHVMRKGNWKFIKTLHVTFFLFGQKWPSRNVTVNDSMMTIPDCQRINQIGDYHEIHSL